MGSAIGLLLLGAAAVIAAAAFGLFWALRAARAAERARRGEALAAAAGYTPAPRQATYGAAPDAVSGDPCAPGLSDAERVSAMRTLLQQGDRRAAVRDIEVDGPATQPLHLDGDDPPTTSPMAWNPTLPPDEAEDWDRHRPAQRPRVQIPEVEHIDL